MRTIALSFVVLVACDGGNKGGLGSDGHACFPDGSCYAGLICAQGICGDGITNDGPIVLVDTPGFQCADDSTLEGGSRNDTIQTAFVTGVATQVSSINFAGLAICPATDKDHFGVETIAALQTIHARVTFQAGPTTPAVAILSAGGGALVLGTSTSASTVEASLTNAPQSVYFVRVTAPDQSNYALSIEVTDP